MTKDRIIYLLEGYRQHMLTPAELAELRSLVDGEEELVLDAFTTLMEQGAEHPQEVTLDEIRDAAQRVMAIDQTPYQDVTHTIHPMRKWFWAAASVLMLLAAGAYFFFNTKNNTPEIVNVQPVQKDVTPGGNRAILKLADGRTIVLDSAANGSLAMQGNTKIEKLSNGQIVYTTDGTAPREMLYNTMSTPRGGQYQLTLPDGTKAWLNAASSITYPAFFAGKERAIKITGEVYLEVAKDKNKPFMVAVNDATIEVLGTHFNVNAYTDEPATRTTLLEGSVQVKKGSSTKKLRPGEQAIVTEQIKIANDVNTDQVLAWKNGAFNLNQLPVDQLMRQLSRWYDVEIVYKGTIPEVELWGEIGRSLQLTEVLDALQRMELRCRLEGKKLIVD